MWWAYHVLGWGGYWGWDPVENVALLPWLASTAYIHSAQVQERRGTLKAWNFGLVILAFLLAVFGTFVVRSGIIQSVHSFAVSAIGPWFLGFLLLCVGVSGLLLLLRIPELRAQPALESLVSREGAFLLNNVLLVAIAIAVLWGTLLPLISGLSGRPQMVVGPAYYERATGPLFIGLLALLALGPLVPWRSSGGAWLRAFRPSALTALAAGAAVFAAGVRDLVPLLATMVLTAAATTCLLEYVRGGRFAARLRGPWPSAAARLALRNRRRYGAYLAHLGLIVIAAGIAGSHFGQQERQVVLKPGEQVQAGPYRLTYLGAAASQLADGVQYTASLRLGNESVEPRRTVYPALGQQSATQVAIRSSALEDLYVVLAATPAADGSASFTIFVNPLVTWIWAGAAIMIYGVWLGNVGGPRRAASPLVVRVPVAVAGAAE